MMDGPQILRPFHRDEALPVAEASLKDASLRLQSEVDDLDIPDFLRRSPA
jgi:hypothetical protein